MSIVNRPTLSPAMMLWEVTAIASRHGLAVSTDNPSACLHYAEQLMRSMGLAVTAEPPAALPAGPPPADATADLPLAPGLGFVDVPRLPRGDRPTDFRRGQHRPGATPTLRSVN